MHICAATDAAQDGRGIIMNNKHNVGDQVVVCGHSLQTDGLSGFVKDTEWEQSSSEWMYLLDTSAHWFDERKLIKPTETEADRLMHACQRAEEAGDWLTHERLSTVWEKIETILEKKNEQK
jgi:hypothetical protein